MKQFTYTYNVDAKGMGFHNFHCQFKNDNLLSHAQIMFIVHCKMVDANKGSGEIEITRMNVRGEYA